MLERYIVIDYPDQANLQEAVDALLDDPTFAFAYVPEDVSFHSGAAEPSVGWLLGTPAALADDVGFGERI